MQNFGITLMALVAGGAIAGAAGGVVAHSMQDDRPAARVESSPRSDRGETDRELAARLDRFEKRWGERIARLETGERDPRATDAPSSDNLNPGSAVGATGDGEESSIEVEQSPGNASPLDEMFEGRFDNDKSNRMYARLGMHRDEIASTIKRLNSAIEKDPDNPELHCALAVAYGAKTAYDTPRGPEQGVVWEKAKNAYKEALRLEPNHWQARYGLAFGDSMAPEFVGLRPKAIEQFEELVRIQEAGMPRDEQTLVYMRLGTLYKDAGSVKKARAAWQRGLDRHPSDENLKKVLALSRED